MDLLNLVWYTGDVLNIRLPLSGVVEVFLISLLVFFLVRRLIRG